MPLLQLWTFVASQLLFLSFNGFSPTMRLVLATLNPSVGRTDFRARNAGLQEILTVSELDLLSCCDVVDARPIRRSRRALSCSLATRRSRRGFGART